MIKAKRNRKWEFPHTVLEGQTLSFSSYKNRELKVKCDELELAKGKRVHFFQCFFCSKEICVLSECTVYWKNFQNIYTFTHQKALLIHFCCFSFKSSKAFRVSVSLLVGQEGMKEWLMKLLDKTRFSVPSRNLPAQS